MADATVAILRHVFRRSAEVYDAVYSFKDYAAEADRLRALFADRVPQATSLLDVACGTGTHLEYLAFDFEIEGLDLDEHLLAVAQARLPGVPLHLGDMTEFALGRRFDIVTCLFSSIGYVGTVEGLHAAIAAMANHLTPGGLLVVEPWFTPDVWIVGRPTLHTVDEPELKVARMAHSGREGRLSIIEFSYLVGTPAGIESLTERHELALFTDDEYRGAFTAAGLDVDHDPEGLTGRGLYLGASVASGR